MMMKTNRLWETVQSQFDAFQNAAAVDSEDEESGNAALLKAARQVQSRFDEHVLSTGMERDVSLKEKTESLSTSSFEEEWNQIMIHVVNCAVATVCNATTTNSSRSTNHSSTAANAAALALMKLVAQLAFFHSQQQSVQEVLDRIIAISKCTNDAVRVLATQTIGIWSTIFWKGLEESSSISRERITHILDALQGAILPRFTDKAVAVRAAAVTAGIPYYPSDPDLRQAGIWILQHDPSPVNRTLAVRALPWTISTMEALILRLRDVKMPVRLAVLEKLQTMPVGPKNEPKNQLSNLLTPELMAEIVMAGYTERCTATKEATQKLVALTWMKAVRYDPVALLRRIGILHHPNACEKVIQAITSFPVENLEKDLSAGEITMYQNSIRQAIEQFSMHNHENIISSSTNTTMDLERLFLARTLITQTKNIREKEDLMAQIVPDIPMLCQILETYANKLVELLAGMTTDDPENVEQEEEVLVSICTQLLALATAIPMEEGSKRVFTNFIKNMLTNILTPDDLMEPAIQALRAISLSNDYISVIVDILGSISNQSNTELQVNYTIRILSILTIVLETVSTRVPESTVTIMAQHVVPNITHENALVREVAVGCLGKLGFYIDTATVRDEYKPQLLNILTNADENMEIRAQAMLALCDWSMLFTDEPLIEERFRNQIQDMMERDTYPLGVRCMAAEIATKLLFTGKVCDSHWLAILLKLYFDDKLEQQHDDEHEDIGITEIGSPVRLQQLLSVFFPAYCAKSQVGRDALTGSVGSVLQASLLKTKRKLPIIKILEFVTATVDMGRSVAQTKDTVQTQSTDDLPPSTPKSDDDGGEKKSEPQSSSGLLVAIQVATFLSEKAQDLNSTNLRALCKFIAGIELVIDNELWEHLSMLKELLEELGNIVDDNKALAFLEQVSELLVDVEMEDEVPEDDEESDSESLTEAFGKIGISSKENELTVSAGVPNVATEKLSSPVSDPLPSERSTRRQRRLLSSN